MPHRSASFFRSACASALPLLLAMLALASTTAHAQSPALQPVRESLATYDLDGDRTIGALRDLHGFQTSLTGAPASEARFLRAVVAVDLLIAARVDPARAALATRVCDVIATPCDRISAHLAEELRAVGRGPYRAPAAEATAMLEIEAALGRGELARARVARRGVRRDLLWLRAVALALGDATDASLLAPLAQDRCSRRGRCAAPWSHLDPASRQQLDVMLEASAAIGRLEDAARRGDSLAVTLVDVLRPLGARIEAITVRPIPMIPESMGADVGPDDGDPVRPDVIVVVLPTEVRIARPPSFGVRAGEIVGRATGDDVLPAAATIALPSELRPIITSIEPVVAALRSREGVIAIAAGPTVPAHVVARIVLSASRAGRPPAMLVRRARDGTLRGAALAIAPRDEIGVAGDLVVRVRTGGYGISYGHGREQSMARVRGADGALGFDHAGLAAAVDRAPHRRTILDAMPSLPARDLFDTAFRLIRPTTPVTLPL